MSAHSVVFAIFVLCDTDGNGKLFLDAELSVVAVGCRRLDRDAVDNPGGTLKVLFVGICTVLLVIVCMCCVSLPLICKLQFEFVKK